MQTVYGNIKWASIWNWMLKNFCLRLDDKNCRKSLDSKPWSLWWPCWVSFTAFWACTCALRMYSSCTLQFWGIEVNQCKWVNAGSVRPVLFWRKQVSGLLGPAVHFCPMSDGNRGEGALGRQGSKSINTSPLKTQILKTQPLKPKLPKLSQLKLKLSHGTHKSCWPCFVFIENFFLLCFHPIADMLPAVRGRESWLEVFDYQARKYLTWQVWYRSCEEIWCLQGRCALCMATDSLHSVGVLFQVFR